MLNGFTPSSPPPKKIPTMGGGPIFEKKCGWGASLAKCTNTSFFDTMGPLKKEREESGEIPRELENWP